LFVSTGKVLRNAGPFLAGAGFVWHSRRGQWSWASGA